MALSDADGAAIAWQAEQLWDTAYWTVAPEAPWIPGEYTLTVLGPGDAILETLDFAIAASAPEPQAPVPVRRVARSEAWTEVREPCEAEGTWTTVTDVQVELCAAEPFVLVAYGSDAPPDPASDGERYGEIIGGIWYSSSEDQPDLAPGATVHAWFGGFDPSGAFLGWRELTFDMPASGLVVTTERAPVATGSGSPTTVDPAACDWDAAWVEVSVTRPAGPEAPPASGCATSRGGSGGAPASAILLTCVARRRRRS